MAKSTPPEHSSSGLRHPFQKQRGWSPRIDRLWTGLFAFFTYFLLFCVLAIIGKIVIDGAPVIFGTDEGVVNWDFFSKSPMTLHEFHDGDGNLLRLDHEEYEQYLHENPQAEIRDEKTISHAGGGILGPLVGTALLVLVSMVIALVLGVATAVYLVEYSQDGRVTRMLRLAIMNLAGVPSIVFGLFGFAFFCLSPLFPVLTTSPDWDRALWVIPIWSTEGFLSFQGWGSSLLAGGATLAIMVLPVIVAACEESLKAVPKGFRETSLALGASRWMCIRTAVLPYAAPGILTASVLGVTRVAGETAAILFTAAVLSRGKLPWQDVEGDGLYWLSGLLTQQVEALPYHLYTISRLPGDEALDEMRYGSVFVFLLLVMGFALVSVVLRSRQRKKLKW